MEPEKDATVNLKLEPPADAATGTYELVVRARGAGDAAELSLELTIQEKPPPGLAFDIELPGPPRGAGGAARSATVHSEKRRGTRI